MLDFFVIRIQGRGLIAPGTLRRLSKMDAHRVIARLAQAFDEALFADNVVLALAKKQENLELTSEDLHALEAASKFFAQAKRGFDWIDNPSLTSDSLECAISFKTASQTVSQAPNSIHFLKDIEQKRTLLEQLVQGHSGDVSEIADLREFFARLLAQQVQDIDDLFANPERQSQQWQQAIHR